MRLHGTGGTGRIFERLSVQVWDLLFRGPKLAHLAVRIYELGQTFVVRLVMRRWYKGSLRNDDVTPRTRSIKKSIYVLSTNLTILLSHLFCLSLSKLSDHSDKFEIKIEDINRRGSRSLDIARFGHFTLLTS